MFANAQDVAIAAGIWHPLPVDGKALHASVPPECWCVTRDDLRRLRAMVKAAVCSGHIASTEGDTFDLDDDRFGPSIYTVNVQFIRPLTALAGNCSWALMCHPSGGKCDVFVTHAWEEGILEFVDKVLHSWPRGARYAYCCMLSNPQNLNIAEMISSPSQSPFAKALRSATHMLVVPNRTQSIYTRVWCAYEAFLAYNLNKMIFTASSPLQNLRRRLIYMAATFMLGVIFFRVVQTYSWANFAIGRILFFSLQACIVISALSRYSTCAQVVNYFGGFEAGAFIHFFLDGLYDKTKYNDGFIAGVGFCLMAAIFFVAAEADRMWGARAQIEADELIRGYTGQLHDAQSSNEEDKRIILSEIDSSGCSNAVHEAVDVLIKAGMSSPSLQQAARLGVDVKSAGRCKTSVAFIAWAWWFLAPLADVALGTGARAAWPSYMGLAEALVCFSIFLSLPMDRRTFTSLAVLKVNSCLYVAPLAAMCLVDAWSTLSCGMLGLGTTDPLGVEASKIITLHQTFVEPLVDVTTILTACVTGPATVLFSAMGPGRLACVPIVGPYLSQYILGITCCASFPTVPFWYRVDSVDAEGMELRVS